MSAIPRGLDERKLLLWLLVLGLALRVGWALLVPVAPVSDSTMYDGFARSIAAGNGYAWPNGELTAFWAVGTSAFYGFLYFLFGTSPVVVVSANLVLGTLLIWLVYLVASRAFGSPTGIVAAAIIACWPLLIQFTTVINSELLFIVLIAAALAAWRWAALPYWGQGLLFATLLVCAVYVRPTALPLLVLLPLVRGLVDRRPLQGAAGAVIAVMVAAAMLMPWALRNAAVFERPVLVSANFGVNLWMGNNPDSDGSFMRLPPNLPADEAVRDSHLKQQAYAYIRENPQDYLRLTVARTITTFGRETIGVAWNQTALDENASARTQVALKGISSAYWLGVFVASLAGVVMFLKAGVWKLFDPLLITYGMFAVVPVLTVGQDRYHMPVIPFVAIFGAMFLHDLFRRFVGPFPSPPGRKVSTP